MSERNAGEAPDRVAIPVAGPLNVWSTQEVREKLRAAVGSGPVVLDLSGVTEVDVAGLQLLCAAHRSALRTGTKLSLKGRSQALWAVAKSAGLLRSKGCGAGCLWTGGE